MHRIFLMYSVYIYKDVCMCARECVCVCDLCILFGCRHVENPIFVLQTLKAIFRRGQQKRFWTVLVIL